jgi:Invasin, domain 3
LCLAVVAVVVGALSIPGAAAAAPLPRIDMRVLLIGTSATEPDFVAWQAALRREGVTFDTIVGATHTPITASTLSGTLPGGGQEGKYQAIIVAVSGDTDCSVNPCVADLSAAELAAIESYEQAFEVRQITGDVFPSAANGLNAPTTTGVLDGVQGSLTPDGQKVFPSLKGPVPMDIGTFGYQATPVSATNFDTLVSGPGGSSLVGVYTHTDGVQEMVQTFNQNQNQLQSELLRHGALAWVTRGVYFGDQRNYLDTNIDDNFLADDSWDTTLHTTDYSAAAALRERPVDVFYAATWSAQNNFRIDQLFNGGGSVAAAGTGTDALLTAFKSNNPATNKPYTSSFGWVNHTWDHPNVDQGCATSNYIQAEINQNTAWGSSAAGLNLTSTTDPTVALGAQNPSVLVTGEHSGLANLLPGNPGIIDPPSFASAAVNPTTPGTLPAGSYTYAITDQFAASGGESSASQTIQTVPANGSVDLSWDAVCHAADYKIYREVTGSNVWTLLTTIPANTTTSSFADPASTTDVTGGGPVAQSYTDTGTPGTSAATPPTVNGATESAYEQNQSLDAAFAAVGIKTFGSDSSKPYPSPATATFPNGAAPTSQYANGATFTQPISGAQAEARYPTNIYYNVSTEAQEVDEYNHLYLAAAQGGACVDSATTTCITTPATFADIIKSIDQGMLQHIMGNDPRPDYFHQTNMMGSPPPGAPTAGTPPATSPSVGDGLYYSTMNQLLASYASYYNVPVQQLTSSQIAQLLAQQAAWAANTNVTGYIQGNQVTITNGGTSTQIPLTGIATVGSTYGGTQSGWTNAAAGTSTYTAQSTWPVDTLAVSLSPSSIAANGTSTSTATATVKDAAGLAIVGDHVGFSSSDSGEKIGAVTDNHDGSYTATITSSTTVGSATITAADSSVSSVSGQATLTQTAGPAASVTVSLAPASIAANGTSTSTATATVKDAAGLAIVGDHVGFSSSDSGEKIGAVTDNHNGTYTATITSSTSAHQVTITATDSSVSPSVPGQATLTQTAGPAASVTVSLAPASIAANGTSTSTATATVKDAAGLAIVGDHVGFSSSDSGEKIGAVTDNHNGTYTATITSSATAHQVRITATDSSVSPSVSRQATLTQTAVAPSSLQAPSISGTATVGRTLTALPGTWSGTSLITYAYQWQRCRPGCSAITRATSSSYTLVAADRGAHVRVAVTARNTRGSAQAYSPQIGPVT